MKAILLVEIDSDHMIKETNDLYERMKGRWSELRPIPARYEGRKEDYEIGWNDAISEILGDE